MSRLGRSGLRGPELRLRARLSKDGGHRQQVDASGFRVEAGGSDLENSWQRSIGSSHCSSLVLGGVLSRPAPRLAVSALLEQRELFAPLRFGHPVRISDRSAWPTPWATVGHGRFWRSDAVFQRAGMIRLCGIRSVACGSGRARRAAGSSVGRRGARGVGAEIQPGRAILRCWRVETSARIDELAMGTRRASSPAGEDGVMRCTANPSYSSRRARSP